MPPKKQKPVERSVGRILVVKRRNVGADTSALDREMDEFCDLCGETTSPCTPQFAAGRAMVTFRIRQSVESVPSVA